MTRQLLLGVLYFLAVSFFGHGLALAKLPNDNTIVMPSPRDEKTVVPEKPKTYELEKHDFLVEKSTTMPKTAPAYHLEPGPSVTLALSRAYEFHDKDHSGWIGARVAPWMSATMRTELGADIHDHDGWATFALQFLPTRNLYRVYWGPALSLIFDSHDELRPVLRLRNYYLGVLGGWELQLLDKQNVRFEVGYYQGTEHEFLKATLGYTFQF